jgi:glycosyltransferase involved in cell wall biosynthesis
VSRPIRILELRSVRGTGGGPEKTILFGAARADPARFAVTVCYIRDGRDRNFLMDQRARELGVDYVEIIERNSFDPSVWPALRALIRNRRIDLVHGHEYKTNLLTWLLAKRDRVIPLSTVHGWFGKDTVRERLYYGADKRVLAAFPRVIAVSSPLKNELVRIGARPERITVIPNGIDPSRFLRLPSQREQAREAINAESGDFVIGAVGRLEHQKRFDLLMQAVALLRVDYPAIRLLIVGDGGLKQQLESLRVSLRLDDGCVLLGHQSNVPFLHQAFDLFVQASDHEGSPNVVLEAMAMGTPIVATDAGGTRDVLEDERDGLLIPTGDAAAIAGAIRRVVGDYGAAITRAQVARTRVETELSFSSRMDRVEAIYEDLVGWRAP